MSNWIRWIVAFIAAITVPLITVGCGEVNPTQTQAIVSKDSSSKTDASTIIPGHVWGTVSLMECSPSAECKPHEDFKPEILTFNKEKGIIFWNSDAIPMKYAITGSILTMSTGGGLIQSYTIKDLTSKSFTIARFMEEGDQKGYTYLIALQRVD